jgi:hypothetical protein
MRYVYTHYLPYSGGYAKKGSGYKRVTGHAKRRHKMKLTTKKIIAREFLTLTLVIVIGLICFLSTFPYNSFRHYQIKNLKGEIDQKRTLSDSLLKSYSTKIQNQEWYFKKLNDEFDLGEFNTNEKWWFHSMQLAKNDSISIRWKGVWSQDKTVIKFFNKIGFLNGDSLQRFIIINNLDKSDIENKTKADNLQKEIAEIESKEIIVANSVLTYEDQFSFSLMALIILASLSFGFRYLYYGIKWSLKTLKQKPE